MKDWGLEGKLYKRQLRELEAGIREATRLRNYERVQLLEKQLTELLDWAWENREAIAAKEAEK